MEEIGISVQSQVGRFFLFLYLYFSGINKHIVQDVGKKMP